MVGPPRFLSGGEQRGALRGVAVALFQIEHTDLACHQRIHQRKLLEHRPPVVGDRILGSVGGSPEGLGGAPLGHAG